MRRPSLKLTKSILLVSAMLFIVGPVLATVDPHPGMLRDPDVSATHIVFRYADDLWLVPRSGGLATPLASPPGAEARPLFSPDGQWIVFQGNYDGNADLYRVPVEGGIPERLTYHPFAERPTDWTAGDEILFYGFRGAGGPPAQRLYRISPEGGFPVALPVPYGTKAAMSGDGRLLAYTPHNRDHRTWKRYQGGMSTDIWLYGLEDNSFRQITDWPGTDTEPMWHGQRLYYLSDAGPAHRRNVWIYDLESGASRQITRFEDDDIRGIQIGPGPSGQGEIVLQSGRSLYLLDLANEELREVRVQIPGARPRLRPRRIDASKFIGSYSLAPSAKRVAIVGRGDVWSAPAEKGTPRNLTRTNGAYERSAEWSPDGRWIAYFSDSEGEYELYITQSDGKGETKRLTSDGERWRYDISWSPDSSKIVLTDNSGLLELVDVASGEVRTIAQDPSQDRPTIAWSGDSKLIAYDLSGENLRNSSIWLYEVETGENTQLTSEMFNDQGPVFDRKGEHLFFATNRHFSPRYAELSFDFIYAGTSVLVAVPLKADQPSPFAPKSDEQEFDGDEGDGEEGDDEDGKGERSEKKGKKDGDEDDGDGDKPEKKDDGPTFEVETGGFEQRAVQIPVDPGVFGRIAVNDKGQLLYLRRPIRGGDGDPSIKLFDLTDDKREEKTVVSKAYGFDIAPDGKHILFARPGGAFIQKAVAGDEKNAKKVVTDGMHVIIDPREEWRQIMMDAWRIERCFFYDPNMHGVDWAGVRDHYMAMLDDAASRDDVAFLIREMLGELNVGHAYYRQGPPDQPRPDVSVGMLGVDWGLDKGAYRIERIIEGGPWDLDGRGPLSQPGVKAEPGDFILAVNGNPVDPSKEPWAALLGLAGKTVTVTLSKKPVMDDDAWDIVIEPLGNDFGLRYRAWVERNRAYVDEQSDGQIGYIHVPNTGIRGQNELVRQYTGQLRKKALIIDDRWNGGGQIPTRFIEMLNRPITNYWARRHGSDTMWPYDAHQGPKTMLINGLAGSGGDAFPWYFRQAGLGPLIGTRTWGGLVGYSGTPSLIDGADVTVPTFAFYEKDGTWGVEGHGVDPDIEVLDDPSKMLDGGDPQLDRAIAEMLDAIEKNPYVAPDRPAYPDRRGMGIPERDR